MAEKAGTTSGGEKLWRFSRDINALGALAIAGVAVAIPGPNAVLATWAWWNTAQAAGSEWLRRRSRRKRTAKTS